MGIYAHLIESSHRPYGAWDSIATLHDDCDIAIGIYVYSYTYIPR